MGLVCLSFFSPLLLVRGPGVSHGWLVNRGFSLLLFDCFLWLDVLLFYLFVVNGDPRLSTSSLPASFLFLLSCLLLLLVLRLSVVCFLACECVLVTFSCWRCRVLCACFVVGVRGGLSFLSVICLLNVCVQERRCSSEPLASSSSVLLSVACRRVLRSNW